MRGRFAGIVACACLAASCGRSADSTPALAVQPPAAAATTAGGTAPHGDHNPRYGGLVLMNGDLHFEIVAGRDGVYRVYFSDATREELPAATASGVTVTVSQPGRQPELVALHIDDSGESWIGRGRAVADPGATVRIAYTAHGTPYFIDVPFPR
ncbi:MAG: hypothetical protein JWL71_62 [Acidobacteria bacterium]|nr:hypothetical protein [Acidobacteriota bacterium]